VLLEQRQLEDRLTYLFLRRLVQVSGGKVPVIRQEEKGLTMPDSDVM